MSRSGEDGFFDRGGLPVHEVLPLSEAAAAELVGDCIPAPAPRVRQRLLADPGRPSHEAWSGCTAAPWTSSAAPTA
jgi:hypothetical protein